MPTTTSTEKATLAGGCFWCLEAAFEQLDGVVSVLPGYMGGHDPQPTYESVCRGDSGHAEVVQIEFDPAKIDFGTLLTAFFTIAWASSLLAASPAVAAPAKATAAARTRAGFQFSFVMHSLLLGLERRDCVGNLRAIIRTAPAVRDVTKLTTLY